MRMECPECGHRAQPGETFCQRCRAYLQWTTAIPTDPGASAAGDQAPRPVVPPGGETIRFRAGPASQEDAGLQQDAGRPQGVPSRRSADQQHAGLHITLAAESLTVDPGGVATLAFVLRNTGSQVEEIRLWVEGAPWLRVHPTSVAVYPGEEGNGVLQASPPRDPALPAGVSRFRITAASGLHQGVVSSAGGQVRLTPFYQFAADLVPPASRGRRRTSHRLLLSNLSNVPVRATIEANDPEGVLQLHHPRTVDVPQGQILEVPFVVQATPTWFGRPESKPFGVQVSPGAGQPPARLAGTRVLVPRFPAWVPMVAAGVIGLSALVGGAVWAANRTTPKTPATSAAASAAAPSTSGSAAAVTGTSSAAAVTTTTTTASASTTTSTTTASTTAPVTLPAVKNLTVAEARGLLVGKGLTVDIKPIFDNRVLKDVVIGYDPATQSKVSPKSTVTLLVSRGPTEIDLAASARGRATWETGTGRIRFDDMSNPAAGAVTTQSTPVLEGGKPTTAPLIETDLPQVAGGKVVGTYTFDDPLRPGDHFRATVGFVNGGPHVKQGTVTFQVLVVPDGGSPFIVGPAHTEVADAHLGTMDVELPADQNIRQLQLAAITGLGDGPPVIDKVVWVHPRIEGVTS